MASNNIPIGADSKKVQIPQTYANVAWRWMRYSGVLLIPLVWFHVILQDVIVGVHRIDLDYVAQRWALTSWRVYDVALLGFAFAHGMNGLRQVLFDYFRGATSQRMISWGLLIAWFVITAIGAIAIIGGVQQP